MAEDYVYKECYFKDIDRLEKKVFKETMSKQLWLVDWNIQAINLLAEMTLFVSKKKTNTGIKAATVLMLPRLLRTSKSVFNLIMKGHYYDGEVIRRSFQENLLLLISFEKNKTILERWLNGKQIDAYGVRNALGLKGAPDHKLYSYLCDFVHSKIPAHLRYFPKESYQQKGLLTLEDLFVYNQEEGMPSFFPDFTIMAIEYLKRIFSKELESNTVLLDKIKVFESKLYMLTRKERDL